jgi:hypothetical protein
MNPYKTNKAVTMTVERTVNNIINSLKSNRTLFYYPSSLFIILRAIKLLPSGLYFETLGLFAKLRDKFRK